MRQTFVFAACMAMLAAFAPLAQAQDEAAGVTKAQVTGLWKGTITNGNIEEHWVIHRQRTGLFKISRLYIDKERKLYARIMNRGEWSFEDGTITLSIRYEKDRKFSVTSATAEGISLTNLRTEAALQETAAKAMILPAAPQGYKLVQRDELMATAN